MFRTSPYKKNTSISIINTGIKNVSDHAIYPKNDGIRTPFSSDIDFTIKFGAFPIYVFAPMNTAPHEIASSILTGTAPSVVATPPLNLEWFADSKLRSIRFQDHKCRLHSNKDSDKQNRNFLDRPPGKVVTDTDFFVRRLKL